MSVFDNIPVFFSDSDFRFLFVLRKNGEEVEYMVFPKTVSNNVEQLNSELLTLINSTHAKLKILVSVKMYYRFDPDNILFHWHHDSGVVIPEHSAGAFQEGYGPEYATLPK